MPQGLGQEEMGTKEIRWKGCTTKLNRHEFEQPGEWVMDKEAWGVLLFMGSWLRHRLRSEPELRFA